MLNETASTRDDRPVVRPSVSPLSREDEINAGLRQIVASVMLIEHEAFTQTDANTDGVPGMAGSSQLVATFEGKLVLDSEKAYEALDGLLAPTGQTGIFRPTKNPGAQNPHTIHIITGRVNVPQERPWWPNALLFLGTLFSVLMIGAQLAIVEIANTNPVQAQSLADDFLRQLPLGLPYAVSLLLILGAHELGHYFAARYHNLSVTLPYFIPLPPPLSMFGTMGAFIQLRQPMRNRKVLMDVGAAGPLAGLIFAVPILLIGLSHARLEPISGLGVYEGDSILYAAAKIATFGHFVPDGRVDVNISSSQLAWAGWTGLLVTALNLIPIGQLDGGHVLYSLVGENARKLFFPLLAVMVGLLFLSDVWLIWVVLLFIFGRVYATPLDMITPLDNRRKAIAVFALIAFVLIFVPAPLATVQQAAQPALPAPRNSVYSLPMIGLAASWLFAKLRR
jgi:hypothetical protein